MRVYGALMWSLGKVISTPEVVRVYIGMFLIFSKKYENVKKILGSFWDKPFLHTENRALFEAEAADLFDDFQQSLIKIWFFKVIL